jgi:hypothetical protein
LERASWDGDPFSRGNVTARRPVAWRQELQWQVSLYIGSSEAARRVPGSDMAPQRQVRWAEDVEAMVNIQDIRVDVKVQ